MQSAKKSLIAQLDRIHTTPLGIERIRKNLDLKTNNIVDWCKQTIRHPSSSVIRKGKNFYIYLNSYQITVNAHSHTIITAHKKIVQ
ncbi:DUF3781 domain-containing protein [Microgenomates group bacterium]|nr:DUF3781 domain-containing protein [Microgenomates group bacterium]